MDQINYQKVQLVVLGLLVSYGIANMCGVNVPVANVPGVNRVIDLLCILLSVDQLRNRISRADAAPPLPIDPAIADLIKFQAAVKNVAANVNLKQ